MTLHAMSKSPDEAYKDASNSVQNNLYYEGATLELFLDLARNYNTQSRKYVPWCSFICWSLSREK